MDFTENYDMFLSEEHELLRKTVRDFAEKEVAPHIREWDRSGCRDGTHRDQQPLSDDTDHSHRERAIFADLTRREGELT